ncbi:MAG: hypothetical protein GX043_02725 [Desulfovibrionales bacterium]|nr:hypothetical protein [Desulfovibrionales bacterium]
MTRIINFTSAIWAKYKQEVHTTLSGTLTKIPVWLWKKNMFFMGVKNTWWKQKTQYFPATQSTQGTHPLFVLDELANQGFRVCPCSSQGSSSRYIHEDCQLTDTNMRMDRNSFLVDRFAFSLPITTMISPLPEYRGKVPQSCIKEGRP